MKHRLRPFRKQSQRNKTATKKTKHNPSNPPQTSNLLQPKRRQAQKKSHAIINEKRQKQRDKERDEVKRRSYAKTKKHKTNNENRNHLPNNVHNVDPNLKKHVPRDKRNRLQQTRDSVAMKQILLNPLVNLRPGKKTNNHAQNVIVNHLLKSKTTNNPFSGIRVDRLPKKKIDNQ